MTAAWTGLRFLIGADRHAPEFDPTVDKIFGDFAHDFKPHRTFALGDWMNCDQVTDYPNECDTDLLDDAEEVGDKLDAWKVTDYFLGNHEERLSRCGLVRKGLRKALNPSHLLDLDRRKIRCYPYERKRGVVKLGKLHLLHGFYTTDIVAKTTTLIYNCCLFGHAHRFQVYQPKNAFSNHTGFAIGMMGKTEQSWEKNKPPSGHMQGFAFGYLHRNGHFDLYPVRIVGEEVVIEGRLYSRR